MIRKSFDAVTKVLDGDQGLVEAIVNTTGIVDMQKENLQPGCWEPILKAMAAGEIAYPTILWGHEWQLPVGKVVHAEELYPGDARLKAFQAKTGAGGLRIVGQYNLETQRGREAYSDVKHELIKQWSVGYAPADDGARWDQKGIHQVTKVGHWPEVSNVLIGASPGTHVMAIKSAEEVLANPELSRTEKGLAIEQIFLKAMEIPTLEGDEAIHNEPLQQASTAIKTLIQQELTEDAAEPDCVVQLAQIWMSLIQWAQGEATEYTDMAADKPTQKSDDPQLQAETTAAAQPDAKTLAEKLTEMVMERLNAPPQHSDSEDSGEDGLTFWARQNIRPNTTNS